MHTTDKAARIAGAVYLLAIVVGPFSLIYVPGVLFVSGNAAATAANIRTHETLFRLGILGDVVVGIILLALVYALYRLFKDVDQRLAVMLVVLGGLIPASIYFVNAINWLAALLVVQGADFLNAFTKAQQDALAYLFIRIHGQGHVVDLVFAGLWLFPFGILVIRSGFFPRFLGIWLIAAGFGWLALSMSALFAPQYQETILTYGQPLFFAELAITFWMLVFGAKVRPLATPAAETA